MKNTDVVTDGGIKLIKCIKVGDSVYDIHNNKIKVINNIKSNKTNKFIKIQQHAFGNNIPNKDLFITSGHPVLINGIETQPTK